MKDHGVLHPQLARVLAETGHTDLVGLCDAGLPVPTGVQRVDLAFAPGKPALLDVLDAVLDELRVEGYVLASETAVQAPWLVAALNERLPAAAVTWVDHADLKRRSAGARAIVRTGEVRPYANVLLVSGVDFDALAG